MEIPERAKRIVYHGETLGDLLALGVKPIGGDEAFARNSVYKHRLKKLANVGFPLDPQLTASLNPDLIILANSDERAYRAVSGIAPTLTFDSFASLDKRMRTLGSWLGKQREAEAWLESFTIKNAAMWQQLYTTTSKLEKPPLLWSMIMEIICMLWECPDSPLRFMPHVDYNRLKRSRPYWTKS